MNIVRILLCSKNGMFKYLNEFQILAIHYLFSCKLLSLYKSEFRVSCIIFGGWSKCTTFRCNDIPQIFKSNRQSRTDISF